MKTLRETDPQVFDLIQKETARQEYGLEMIPSENFVSEAVLEAIGSVLTNKYAEGLPRKRYYGGCQIVDSVEELAITRAKELFGAEFVNVQPHSGAQANQACRHKQKIREAVEVSQAAAAQGLHGIQVLSHWRKGTKHQGWQRALDVESQEGCRRPI